MIGAAVAVALGLLLGFWARPNLKSGSGAADSDLAPPNRAVPIEVQRPAPQTQPKPAGKLEVLSPAEAAAARAQAAAPPPAQPAPQSAPQVAGQAPAVPPAAAPLAAAPPRAAYRASFDCAGARPGAEQMVCSDPELAAEDRALARAYRRALASGAPPGALRADQRDWIGIREDAARHSRRALAEVYQQRIDELNHAADEDGPPPPPDDDGPGD